MPVDNVNTYAVATYDAPKIAQKIVKKCELGISQLHNNSANFMQPIHDRTRFCAVTNVKSDLKKYVDASSYIY